MIRMRTLLAILLLSVAGASRSDDIVSGPLTMAVSTQKKILVVRIGATEMRRYTVAVGTKAKPTPMGTFTVKHIVWNPAWHPPDASWAKGKEPAAPGDPNNPMKIVKIFFQEPDYYIHGTDAEDSLGSAASHGCIRMAQEDVYKLARYLQDHAGAEKSEDWYAQVINGNQTQSVILPQGVPLAIGK
jgi:lipoprotein-anchoring transpeptidase ErfK/SrfK